MQPPSRIMMLPAEIYSVITLTTKRALLKDSLFHAAGDGSKFQGLYSKHGDFVVLLVEATLALYYQMRNATHKATIAVSMCSFYHAITGRSCAGSALRIIDSLVEELTPDLPFFQSGMGWIDVLDGLYTNTKRVIKSALGDKLARVFNHVVAISFYDKAGIKFDPAFFGEMEKKHIRPTVWSVASFVDAIVGLVLFLCKAGRQAMSTGSLECFFIDDAVLTAWVDKASALRKDFEFLNSPLVVGTARPQYIHDLESCIATGKKLLPHFKKGREHATLLNMILELEVLHKRQQVTMLASSFRRAPVAILIYGAAGVAKTFIAQGLFNHYCSVRGITQEAAKMWTRTEGEEFYSGYKSHFAGVLYDDAAKFRPNVIQGVDPSIKDIISAANNVPFVTPQADLPDKGKIPFLSEWLGVTSNINDLNANLFFNTSAAFIRRFIARIEPVVKPEFCVPGETRIDASKIPPGEQFPNMWDFKCCLPKVAGMAGQFLEHKVFTSYGDLLEWLTPLYQKHIDQQNALMETVGKIGPEKLCDCNLPVSICRCEQTEGGPILFGSFDTLAQSDGVCTKKHWKRVGALSGQKHALYAKYTNRTDRAFLDMLYDDPAVAQWFNPSFCDASVGDDDTVVKNCSTQIEGCMAEFLNMDPRSKMNNLSEGAFARCDEGDLSYLTFDPEFGPRGHFLESQLTNLRETVLQFCGSLTDKELALLDVYVQEEAPMHIAAGWSMGDIVRGGYDYVKHYSVKVEDPYRVEVREFMLGTGKRRWYERLGVSVAVAYFHNKWAYNTLNFLSAIPFVQSVFVWAVRTATSNPRSRLGAAGRMFDLRHGGGNKYVCVVLGAISVLSVALLAARFMSHMRAPHKHEVERVSTCPRHEDCESTLSDYDHEDLPLPDNQMDLNSVGKLPTVRPSEKVNVWSVKERAITRLDVDVRRPHNEGQLEATLRNNVVFACVRGELPLGPGKANTRALVIDNETLVLNNHALPRGCSVEIWVGPVHDEGVKPSFVLEVDERMVTRYPHRDIAIIKTWAMPCRFKNIKHLLTRASYESVGPSAYYVRHKDNSLETLECIGVTLSGLQGLAGAQDVVCQAWSTRPTRPTVSGECGSPLVVHGTLGSVVVGIHAGYNALTGTAWAVRIFREDFDDATHPEVGIIKPAYPVAQVGGFLDLSPRDKLYTDYHRDGHLVTHGQLKSFVARPKFTGTLTPYAGTAFALGSTFVPPIEDNMAAPRSAGWKQPQLVLANYLQPTHSMSEMIMRACVQAFCEHIEAGLTQEDLDDVHPVPLDVAVNGYPGVPNVDAQKHSTSAGHGKRGPKLQFMTEPERNGVWDSFRKFDAATLSEVDAMRELMRSGVRPHAIYDACWKNEMLSKAKVEAGKARSIYMCPLAFLANIRMSTMALCRVMIRRRDLFGIAVGLNTHSEEWDLVYRLAQRIPGDNWIASDFQAFEAVLNLLISNSTSKVFLHVAALSGNYDEEEMMAFRVMLADISNATINFFGELITLLGGEASGHQLTTFFNCLANNLLHMYAYVVINKESEEFDEYLRVAREFFLMVFRNTLGDDVYTKVHPDRPAYNHTTIQSVFADIGITYTMAEKGAASKPYVSLEEVSFLKRRFVDHSAFPGMKVAALDRKSIYKMICYTVPSHSASVEEQLAAALASAQAEAFFHDREFFGQIQSLISRLPKSAELEFRISQIPPPTWSGMIARFVRASPQLQVRMLVPGDAETNSPKHSYCHASELELQTGWSVDAWGSTTMGRSPEDRFYGGVRLSTKFVPKDSAFEITPDPDNNDFSKDFHKTNKNSPTTEEREMAPKVVAQAINKIRKQTRARKRREKWSGVAQADISYDTVSVPGAGADSSVDVTQQQIVFKNEPAGVKLTSPTWHDEIASSMSIQQDIGNFLSRPRVIYSYAWAENGANGYKTDFQPWSLFFNDSTMTNKLQGFHLIRCSLKVKFLINGSPFYYGSMMATYTPLNGYRLDTAEAVGVETRLTATSQKPHVWLENQNCSTAEMELPFLYPYPFLNIGTLANLTNMGTIHFSQFAPLLSANGSSSTNVDIQVYAWAEDIQLSGPTSMPVLQSEFVPNGQISGPASAVASVARSLKNTPIIGPYAKATEMIASGVGSVAQFFGFTNVPNVRDVEGVKQVPFSLASAEISEPVQKLSMQAKQETALGAAQHGGGTDDELHLAHFCGRSAYISGPTWSTTDAPGTIMFTACVMPQMFTRTATEIAHSPMSYAANFFQYWRGSIKYTFKVIRSPYHRGRLQISWDSGTSNLGLGPALGNPNTLSTIMDLDEDSECSFVVPYMQPQLFTPTYAIPDTGSTTWVAGPSPGGNFSRSNGVINVRVLNRLTAPEASSSATVLVFASACDDIEFAAPRDYVVNRAGNVLSLNAQTVAVAQSDVQYNDEAGASELMPRGESSQIYNQVFGEKITSLREYMHRSSLSFLWYPGLADTNVGSGAVIIPIKRMPPPPGVNNNGWWLGTTVSGAGQTAFYTKMHPILAFSTCFIGYKGSVNVNVNVDQPATSLAADTLEVYRVQNGDALSAAERRPSMYVYSNPANTIGVNAQADNIAVSAGRAGLALTNTKTNAGISAQLPYYSNSGFQMCDPRREYSNTDTFTDRNNDWWRIEWRYNKSSAATSTAGALTSVYYATGPDFDCVYFINVPVLTNVAVTAP